jgi:hypothetical protein
MRSAHLSISGQNPSEWLYAYVGYSVPTKAKPKVKMQTSMAQLNPEDYKRFAEAAESSGETVSEWIASMCHTVTRD